MYKFFQVFVLRPFFWVFFAARLKGQQNIPRQGSAILVANHHAAVETVVWPALVHRRMAFLAKAELFTGNKGPWWRFVAWFLKAIDMVPLDRAGGRDTLTALSSAVKVLEQGKVIGIFPEGTRSPDGRLYKGKTGAARLALATGAPVIPVGLINTRLRKTRLGVRWWWRSVAKVGQPIRFDEYLGRSDDRDVVRFVTDEIMAAIQQLTGQDYVDIYASSAKYGKLTQEEIEAHVLPRPGFGQQAPATNTSATTVIEGGTRPPVPSAENEG